MILAHATLQTMGIKDGQELIHDGCVVIEGDNISWQGLTKNIPDKFSHLPNFDCEQRLLTPGLIDCHTHIVYGGDRAHEFEMRLEGADYKTIAERGGGIISTVQATRNTSEEELLKQAKVRLQRFINEGVTTIEIKSGYGLDFPTERKMLSVAKKLAEDNNIRVCKTFLGAHAIPPEYLSKANDYIDYICQEMLPKLHEENLVDAVDAYVESFAFSTSQIKKLFAKAKSYQYPIKLHAEQFSYSGGAEMAAAVGALSVDHLEHLPPEAVPFLKSQGTVAVLLPGAFYTLRETQKPPIEHLRKHDVPMAIGSDCNPGSSPIHSILLSMNMACVLFGLTPKEALCGVTRNAAAALGIGHITGAIEQGKSADICLWETQNPVDLCYATGANLLYKSMFRGQWRKSNQHKIQI